MEEKTRDEICQLIKQGFLNTQSEYVVHIAGVEVPYDAIVWAESVLGISLYDCRKDFNKKLNRKYKNRILLLRMGCKTSRLYTSKDDIDAAYKVLSCQWWQQKNDYDIAETAVIEKQINLMRQLQETEIATTYTDEYNDVCKKFSTICTKFDKAKAIFSRKETPTNLLNLTLRLQAKADEISAIERWVAAKSNTLKNDTYSR